MPAKTSPSLEDLKLGALVLATEESSPLPLQHTDVTGQIIGPIVSVTVTQRFGNPFKDVVELAYLFPLPHEAAVVDYEITIGSRVVKAEMKELQAAREAYQEAIEHGKRASLLEQRRPNLFSIQIGNVQPGETIVAKLLYQERLRYSDGNYEFVFPMGITPRYHNDPNEMAETDAPIAVGADATSTGDLKLGRVTLALTVNTGADFGDQANPVSPSHTFDLKRQDDRQFNLMLTGDNIPNKDFVLRYNVAAESVKTAAWVSGDGDTDTVMISALPPRLSREMKPEPREFIFVIDRSGSMSGGPIDQAKNALRACLRALDTKDSFNIQAFDDHIEWFKTDSQPISQDSVDAADTWLNTVDARGGTEILGAIDAALSLKEDKSRQRYVVFLTDGAVSAEDRAIAEIRKKRGAARVFTFGIGPSVNRALLAKMADFGRGTAQFLQLTEDIEEAVIKFQDRVAYPVLQDIELEWKGAETWDTYPSRLPDLYIGQPLELTTRLKRTGPVTLSMKGKRAGKTETISVTIPTAHGSEPALRRVWARARVDSLLEDPNQNADTVRQQVIGLAIEHRLLTKFTAFVAVDSEVTTAKDARHVNVAVPLPEGLDIEGFVGGQIPLGGRSAMMMTGAGGFAPQATAGLLRRMSSPPPPPSPAQMPASMAPAAAPHKPSDPRILNKLIDKAKDAFGGKAPEPEETDAKKSGYIPAIVDPAVRRKLESSDARYSDSSTADAASLSVSIAERIKELARVQNISGSWGSNADEIEMTAATLIAFVRAGHTTRAGSYRRQLQKALNFLTAANATGFAAFAKYRALSELAKATGDAEDHAFAEAARKMLPNPSTDAERAALGENVTVPAKITTIDDVRITALIGGEPHAPMALALGAQSGIVAVWAAVGKA